MDLWRALATEDRIRRWQIQRRLEIDLRTQAEDPERDARALRYHDAALRRMRGLRFRLSELVDVVRDLT